ncbi:MAG: DUF4421 family protein [Bacteroidia bacterium]
MKTWMTLVFLATISQLTARGIDFPKGPISGRDSTCIRTCDLPWSFRLYTVNKISEMVLRTPNDSLPAATYNPRSKIAIGVGVFYRSVGIWTGLRVDVFDKNKKTIAYDLQLNQYAKRFANDLYLQYYEGVYLNNAYDYRFTTPVPREAEFRGDIKTLSLGISSNYYVNWEHFSTRAPFIQSELQLKNAGSAILGGSLNNFSFNADSSVFPNAKALQPSQAIRSGSFSTVAGNIGYAYTFVLNKYGYINLNAIAGPGLTRWEYLIEDASGFKGVRPMLRVGGRISAGYNWDRFFTGMSAVIDQFNIFYNRNTVNYVFGNVRLFVGYRPDFNRGRSNR